MPDYHTRQQEIQLTLETLVLELKKNEEQFWQLVESMPSAVVIINVHGIITYANKRITDAFDYIPDELVGKSVDMLLPQELHGIHGSHRLDYFTNPSNRSMGNGQNLVARRKDGTIFPVEIGLGYLTTHEDMEAIAFIVDITERKRREDSLLEGERLLKRSQALAHVGSWEVDLDTGETIWSDEFFRICGLEPQSIVPSAEIGFTIIHPDDRDKAGKAFEQTQKTNEPYKIEKRIVRPDGEVRWVISLGEIISDLVTGAQRLSGVFIDITDRKKAEYHEMQYKLEQERMKLLANFIQDVSHEFRTPLSIINSSAYLMAKSQDAAVRNKKATAIQNQVQLTTHLLEMLLTMVKLETTQSLQFAPIHLDSMLNELCYVVRNSYGESPTIQFEIPDNLPIYIGDAGYLIIALTQIIDNAFRFTPNDGSILFCASATEKHIILECHDTGCGIAEQDIPLIFDTFWRSDKAHSTSGFGLGLTIAKKIIDLHQGQIIVTSQINQGTEVTVRLNTQT